MLALCHTRSTPCWHQAAPVPSGISSQAAQQVWPVAPQVGSVSPPGRTRGCARTGCPPSRSSSSASSSTGSWATAACDLALMRAPACTWCGCEWRAHLACAACARRPQRRMRCSGSTNWRLAGSSQPRSMRTLHWLSHGTAVTRCMAVLGRCHLCLSHLRRAASCNYRVETI